MSVTETVDAVVCGAGVAGLATACALGQLGLQVVLLDKQRRPRPVAKGEVLQPGALNALRSWGAERRLKDRGALSLSLLVVRDVAGEPLMTLDYRRLAAVDHSLLVHDYPSIQMALTDCLGQSVVFHRGSLAKELVIGTSGRVGGVRITGGGRSYELAAPLVVAADGIGSRLRRATEGQAARRSDYPHRLLTLEITDAPERPDDFSAYVSDRGMRLCYPLPGGRIRLYLQVGPDELRGLAPGDIARWCREALAEVPALHPLTEPALAVLDRRQLLPVSRFLADRLATPGLALVGEAAHAVHPMASQGMNSAIADAATLAQALSMHRETQGSLTATAVDAALEDYHRIRMPELTEVARMSHNATRMVTGTAWGPRVLGRRAARRTAANPRLLRAVTHNMSGLGVRPLTLVDRLQQFGLLPDPRAHRLPG